MTQFTQILLSGLISGILVLDSVQACQFLFSRPFFAGIILGLANGCPIEGAVMGLLFDLLYSFAIPVGGSIPPNGLAGIAAASIAFGSAGFSEPMAFFYGMLFAWLYSLADNKIRIIRSSWNLPFAEKISHGFVSFKILFLRSFAADFLVIALMAVIAGALAMLISFCVPHIAFIENGARFAYSFVPVLGISSLYFHFRRNILALSSRKSNFSDAKASDSVCGAGCSGQSGKKAESQSALSIDDADKKMLSAVFRRLFFIQAGWNYERFQNFGFLYAMMPFIEKIYPDPVKRKAAMLRNFQMVNTHPVMASLLAGVVARLEEDFSAGKISLQRLSALKQSVSAAAAAAGDRFFWARLKPIALQLGIFAWLLAGYAGWLFNFQEIYSKPSAAVLIAGPIVSISVYSFFAVSMRWNALKAGYYGQENNLFGLSSLPLEKYMRRADLSGFFFSVALIIEMFAFFFVKNSSMGTGKNLVLIMFVLMVLALFSGRLLVSRGIGMHKAAAVLLLAAIVFSAAGVPLVAFCL